VNRWGLLATGLTIIAVGGAVVLILIPPPKAPVGNSGTGDSAPTTTAATTQPAGIADLITVNTPAPGSSVSSTTLSVEGSARGSWYFEAVFPVEVRNSSGGVIAQGQGQAQSDWMTEDFVTFKATLTYPAQPHGSHGMLVLKNDNPSGDPARQKEVDIPIVFN